MSFTRVSKFTKHKLIKTMGEKETGRREREGGEEEGKEEAEEKGKERGGLAILSFIL